MPRIFSGTRREWRFVLKFLIFSMIFWFFQFAYQFYFVSDGLLGLSLVRSFAFAGATFFSFSLLSSILFRLRPVWAIHWGARRSFGVMGFVFIFLHFLYAVNVNFMGDLNLVFWSFNPLENPVIFGYLALPIFFLLFITSTDRAVQKLGAKWKSIQRLVYFGFWVSVLHFLAINPPMLMNLAGGLLLGSTALALVGEFYWFLKIRSRKSWLGLGAWIGYIVILLWILLGYSLLA